MTTKKITPKTRDEWDTLVKEMEKEERHEAEQYRKHAQLTLSRQHTSNNPLQSKNPIPTVDELKDIPPDFGYSEEDKKRLLDNLDHAHFLCSHCRRNYLPQKQLICVKCKEMWYCSKLCAQAAWDTYHRRECPNMHLRMATQEKVWINWLSEVDGRDEAILNLFSICRHDSLVPLHPITQKPLLSDTRDLIPFINAQAIDEKIAAAPKDNPAALEELEKLTRIISVSEWKHLALLGRVPLSISRWFETRDKNTSMLAVLRRKNQNVLMKINVDPNRHKRKTIPKYCECLDCGAKRTTPTNTETKKHVNSSATTSTTEYGSCDISLSDKTQPTKKKQETQDQGDSSKMHEYDSENGDDIEINEDGQKEIEIREKEKSEEQEVQEPQSEQGQNKQEQESEQEEEETEEEHEQEEETEEEQEPEQAETENEQEDQQEEREEQQEEQENQQQTQEVVDEFDV